MFRATVAHRCARLPSPCGASSQRKSTAAFHEGRASFQREKWCVVIITNCFADKFPKWRQHEAGKSLLCCQMMLAMEQVADTEGGQEGTIVNWPLFQSFSLFVFFFCSGPPPSLSHDKNFVRMFFGLIDCPFTKWKTSYPAEVWIVFFGLICGPHRLLPACHTK